MTASQLVPDLPNLARTPLGLGLGDEQRIGLDRLTIAFNQALAAGLQQIRDGMLFAVPADLKLIGLDSNALLDGVIANPEAFGFSDVTSSCLSALAAGTAVTCEGFLFFDDMHPTTAMHRLIGDRFFTRIPEPSTSALLAIALFAALRSRGTLREH